MTFRLLSNQQDPTADFGNYMGSSLNESTSLEKYHIRLPQLDVPLRGRESSQEINERSNSASENYQGSSHEKYKSEDGDQDSNDLEPMISVSSCHKMTPTDGDHHKKSGKAVNTNQSVEMIFFENQSDLSRRDSGNLMELRTPNELLRFKRDKALNALRKQASDPQ